MRSVPSVAALRGRMAVVAGMSRGGTTYLYHHLPRHPAIHAPARKELCWFGHNSDRGIEWMLEAYRGIGDAQRALDVCGLYFFSPRETTRRLRDFDPEARVLLVLRDPVAWVESLYEHYSEIWETPSLPEFVEGCVWKREGREIALGFRSGSVRRAVEHFRAELGERLLLCDFRLLGADPVALLGSIEAFLGLPAWFDARRVDARPFNARGSRRASWVTRLARIPGADRLNAALPRGLTRGLRRWLESGPNERGPGPGAVGPEGRRLLERELAEDRAFLRELFAASPVVDGAGRPRLDAPGRGAEG